MVLEKMKLFRLLKSNREAIKHSPAIRYEKKAVLLTLITITILSLFAITYTTHSLFQDRFAVNERISTLNSLVASIEQDLPRQIYISGYRSILIFSRQIVEEGVYVSDLDASLSELFFNATLDGYHQDLMDDAVFSSIESFLSTNAQKVNADISLQNPTISMSQSDPWNIEVILDVNLIVNDKGGLANWNKTLSVVSLIPITNFDDPVYSVNTAGRVLLRINQTPYQTFVTGSDYTNLQDHFQNSLYIASTSAPNFIMRLQGNLSSSPTGIESLVNPQKLADVGISAKYKSVVDYIYFSAYDPTKYTVPAVSNLILDDQDNHLAKYNVSGVAVPV
jgi:hypothetical protein